MPHLSSRDAREAVSAVAVLAALTADVVQDGSLSRWERTLLARPAPAAAWWRAITATGDAPTLLIATGVGTAAAALRRDSLVAPGLTVLAGVLARSALCRAVSRTRPPQEWWQQEPTGHSFPSRHTTWAALAAGAVVDAAPARLRPAAVAAEMSLLSLVGASRVRLGMHWPTDVAAGLLTAVGCRALGRLNAGRRRYA